KILELEPSATVKEIKQAYRKLAQQTHPDKNSNDPYAAIHFAEIKEAYEVLTNPSRKDYYLQQRWYLQSLGEAKFNNQALTPPLILKQFLALDKHIATLDTFRMDKRGLYEHLAHLLSDNSIELLRKFNEPDINREIIYLVLRIARFLEQPRIEELARRLIKLCINQD